MYSVLITVVNSMLLIVSDSVEEIKVVQVFVIRIHSYG